jgi:hypothetical protein
MLVDANEQRSTAAKQFSLAQLLIIVTAVCLLLALVLNYRELATTRDRLAETRDQLASTQPLAPEEVARQFAEHTTLGPIKTKVNEVRYSPKDDAYLVDFSWTDATTGQTWSSDVQLTSNGFGRYGGQIRNDPFIQPLGYKEFFLVVVSSKPAFNGREQSTTR